MGIMKSLHARSFLVGLITTFVLLSIAGWCVTENNMFVNFQRIYQSISPESQFYPTAREIAAVTKDKLASDKISVIIAGSSVMRGAGQSPNDLWSDTLQKLLGDNFRVLNLALNGGGLGGQGLYMAEMLSKKTSKVIVISDAPINGGGTAPDNGAFYRGFFFDAESRGYLSDFPERKAFVLETLRASDNALVNENRIKAGLNSYLNFNDLWTTVGYRDFSTVWTTLTIYNPWGGRVQLPDTEPNCQLGLGYKSFITENSASVSGFANQKLNEDVVRREITRGIPPEMRSRLMLVVNQNSPFYVSKLDETSQNKFNMNMRKTADVYRSLGITSIPIGKIYNEDDFCDRVHLSYMGGQKLASYLAPFIQQKAVELGYE